MENKGKRIEPNRFAVHLKLTQHFKSTILQFFKKANLVLSLCVFVCVFSCSVMSDSATPWTVVCQAPLSTGFSSRRSSQPRDRTRVSCIGRQYFTTTAICEAHNNTTSLGKTYSTHSYVGHSQELEIKGLLSSQSLLRSSRTLLCRTTLAQPPRNRFQPQGL